MIFVWLMVTGACVSVFLLCLLIALTNVWIGCVAGSVGGTGLFFMVCHVLRLTKQPV
jgi:hypothetical protein